jgi:tRNAThr (cytosine32-N3)-methyltransferase
MLLAGLPRKLSKVQSFSSIPERLMASLIPEQGFPARRRKLHARTRALARSFAYANVCVRRPKSRQFARWRILLYDCAVDSYALARQLIDAAHSGDPKSLDGRPAELVYADRMEAWLLRLAPNAPDLLRLAARCQHLERWRVPRDSFPADRAGYLVWRKVLYGKQSERARELLLKAGIGAPEAKDVVTWVSKTGLKTNANTQLLEDAACLVFLENEISGFAAQHADYPREKFIGIVQKTWRKMSQAARETAHSLTLPSSVAELINEAVPSSAITNDSQGTTNSLSEDKG